MTDVDQIQALKYRYLRSLDTKQWDEFADTLCADVRARYGSHAGGQALDFPDRDALVTYLRDSLGPEVVTVHAVTHPEIAVEGDHATGSWLLQDVVLAPEHKVEIRGAAYYRDAYRREDGVWRIAATGYERLYESMTSWTGTPSYTLLG